MRVAHYWARDGCGVSRVSFLLWIGWYSSSGGGGGGGSSTNSTDGCGCGGGESVLMVAAATGVSSCTSSSPRRRRCRRSDSSNSRSRGVAVAEAAAVAVAVGGAPQAEVSNQLLVAMITVVLIVMDSDNKPLAIRVDSAHQPKTYPEV